MECDRLSADQDYKIETPDLRHVDSNYWNFVYEPAEDSYLLLDALEKDLNYIRHKKPIVLLEIGSGSGIIITAISKIFKSLSYCLAIDINKYACQLTKVTSVHNSASVEVIQGDLAACLCQHKIDMVIFNPPYVVTPSDEVNSANLLTRSWAGGTNGCEVINKFLNSISRILSQNGFGYLLVLKENIPNEIIRKFEEKHFECKTLTRRKLRGEELYVLKFSKKK